MRNEEFFRGSEDGLYLTVCRNQYKPDKDYELFSDPTSDYDVVFDDYAKMDGYYSPISVLLMRVVDGELHLTEETEQFRKRLEEFFENEEIREFSIPPAANLAKPLLIHIARWPDGDYGTIGRTSEDAPDEIQRQVDKWIEEYGDRPQNKDIMGVVLRLTQTGNEWTAERVCDAPAAPAPAEEMSL